MNTALASPGADSSQGTFGTQTGLTAYQLMVLTMLEELLTILGDGESSTPLVSTGGNELDSTAAFLVAEYTTEGIDLNLTPAEASELLDTATYAELAAGSPDAELDTAIQTDLLLALQDMRYELSQIAGSGHEE